MIVIGPKQFSEEQVKRATKRVTDVLDVLKRIDSLEMAREEADYDLAINSILEDAKELNARILKNDIGDLGWHHGRGAMRDLQIMIQVWPYFETDYTLVKDLGDDNIVVAMPDIIGDEHYGIHYIHLAKDFGFFEILGLK